MAISDTQSTGIRTPLARPSPYDWGLVGLLFLLFTLNFADKAAIGLAESRIRTDLHLSASQYGLLSSAFFWLFALGAVVLTAWIGKVSYPWAGGLLMLSWVASMLPLTVPTAFGALLLSRLSTRAG